MGDPVEPDRPAKRIKLAPRPENASAPPDFMSSHSSVTPHCGNSQVSKPTAGPPCNRSLDFPNLHDFDSIIPSDQITWSVAVSSGSTSALALKLDALGRPEALAIASTGALTAGVISSVSQPVDFDPTGPMDTRQTLSGRSQIQKPSQKTSPNAVSRLVNVAPKNYTLCRPQALGKSPSSSLFVSPFTDCIGSFGTTTDPKFSRPLDGKVNGYIKFHWPERRASIRAPTVSVVTECQDDDEDDDSEGSAPTPALTRSYSNAGLSSQLSPNSFMSRYSVSPSTTDDDFRGPPSSSRASPMSLSSPMSSPPSSLWPSSQELVPASRGYREAPRKVPPQFGLHAKWGHMDGQFWSFYIHNWCPGRSVLARTNLWLQDFAKMHEHRGVRAAIQSLAGIYIYDYQPMEAIRNRTNDLFETAEKEFSQLLDNARTGVGEADADVLITIASILSMQDIVLTERRLKQRQEPRWLRGYRQSEYLLEATDGGSRFWHPQNAQLSSLRISQSIITGRALILAQPMMRLPEPSEFDAVTEAQRFGFLLYGTEKDMYEIHGGCGFSKKLLHVLSQITYCAARLQQDKQSTIVPMTTEFIGDELSAMRQWSGESKSWEDVQDEPKTIERVRACPKGYVINDRGEMTDVTAEAWRIAAILYLQCRALRLPRNHEEVLGNLSDLAKCIRVMPRSGTHFTAQAPLFPVFLLGLLATTQDHKEVSKTWFDDVVETPVRSSVPPLYDALKRIWAWIDTEPELTPPMNCDLPENIGSRQPWWEHLVSRIGEEEEEVLCLT